MKERRKFIRLKAPFCVEYKAANYAQGVSGVIRDFSLGGAKVAVDLPSRVKPKNSFSLSIFLPERVLEIGGKVVWSKDKGESKDVGVCFIDIPADYERYIDRYISDCEES